MIRPTLLALSFVFILPGRHETPAPVVFRGGPDHLGLYDSPAPTLGQLAWKFQTHGRVISSPAVADNTVFVGSSDGNVYAVRASDGAERWRFATHGAVNSSPAVANGIVFVASADGNIYAIDSETGRQRWMFTTGGERRFTAPGIHGALPKTEVMPDPFDVFLSSPTIADGVLYIGSGDHNVYALDVSTGALRWKFTTGNVVHATPAVSGGVVYIGSWDRNMYALDAATGRERWHFQTGDDTTIYNQIGIASSAAVAAGVVYFGCRDGHFYAVDAAKGTLKWSHDNKGGWVIASPAVKDGVVYFPTSDGTRFKALEAATGAIRFDVGNKVVSFSSPAIARNTAYYGTSDGWLHAVDINTGRMVAEFQSDGSKANASRYIMPDGRLNGPAMYEDRTYDSMLIGLHRMFELGSIISSPVVAGGVLYVGSTDGNLYALR